MTLQPTTLLFSLRQSTSAPRFALSLPWGLRAAGRGLLLFGLCLLLTGCAQWVRDRADEKIKNGQYEVALQELEAGIKSHPADTLLRAGLISAQNEALARLTAQTNQQRGFGQYDDALKTLARADALFPQNAQLKALRADIALDQRTSKALLEANALATSGKKPQALRVLELALREAPRQSGLLALQRRLEGELRAEDPSLGLRSLADTRPITLDFRGAPLSGVLEAITKSSGINFIFDRDVKQDGRVTVFLRQSPVQDALDLVLGAQALTRRIVDPTTVLIYPNTADKQREHQEQIVRVFHLANAEAKTTAALLKAMLRVKDPFVDERANLVAIRESADVVALAERLVALHDVGDAEVMLDVEILEVSSSRLLDLGISFPSSLTLTPLTAAGATAGLTLTGLRGLNADSLGASVSPLTINLRREVGDATILANPRIRAKNREKAKILIGDKVPVVTTTSSASGIVGQNINYLEVGLKLEVEPVVSPDEEVTIKLGLEVSTITQQISTGNGGTAYQIGTRNANTVLRLRDGETQMLGGLISNADKSNAQRVPGLGDLPILGRLFSAQQDNKTKNELVLAITPRILRPAPRPDLAQAQLWVGTDQTPRLRVTPSMAAAMALINTPAPTLSAAAPTANATLPSVALPSAAAASGAMQGLGQAQAARLPIATPASPISPPPARAAPPLRADTLPVRAEPVEAPAAASSLPITPQLTWQSPSKVNVGQVFSVSLALSSPVPVRGLPLEVSYSPDSLEVVEVIEGDFLKQGGAASSFTHAVNPVQGKVSLGQLRSDGSSTAGRGSVVTLRFKAQKSGDTQLHLASFNPLATDKPLDLKERPSHKITVQ